MTLFAQKNSVLFAKLICELTNRQLRRFLSSISYINIARLVNNVSYGPNGFATLANNISYINIATLMNNLSYIKAKFHYASWFGAGSEHVRS